MPEFYDKLVPISGKITFKGKPLAKADITFLAVGEGAVRSAYGMTDDDGNYDVFTPIRNVPSDKSKGVVPGSYRVLVSKIMMPDGSPIPRETLSEMDAIAQGAKEPIPVQYSQDNPRSLTADVSAGNVVFNFDLK